MHKNKIFHSLKPIIPRSVQLMIRRLFILGKRKHYSHIWPIDPNSATPPENWVGWPGNKRFALVLSHDVETKMGLDKCMELAIIEMKMGFRSSFNFVPERYNNSTELREHLVKNDFEVAIHGLKHDGKLFWTRKIFNERAKKINEYLKTWDAVGFHSPCTIRNLDWIHDLDIEYDQSTFDTDPFEPQPEGVGTIFPYWHKNETSKKVYVELPYTLPQDHALFIIMQERDIRIWKQKLDWIADKGGMALVNTHPDYINFHSKKNRLEEYSIDFYIEFLEYILKKYNGQYWHVLPKEVAQFWREDMVEVL